MTSSKTNGLFRGTTRHGAEYWSVNATKPVTYDVVVSNNLFDLSNPTLAHHGAIPAAVPGSRRLVVIDSVVDRFYGESIRHYFDHFDVHASFHVLEAHELVKDWDSVRVVVEEMARFGIDRRGEPVVAIGGGVLLDIVGFASSIYRRSIPYIRIPTTLIGLVDAGVGVKTGVNFGQGKNKIGTYAAPTVTYVDRSFLRTLDRRHLANGFAEILKVALIKSAHLMELLDDFGRDLLDDGFRGTIPALDRAAGSIIADAIQLMLEELQPNLWEAKLERCVDYGHTFSPTIEMNALPELLHGEAVCIDMALSSILAFQRGYMTDRELRRVLSTMVSLDLVVWDKSLDEDGILDEALADIVRHRAGQQRIPLPVGIGQHRFVNDLTRGELASALDLLRLTAHELSESTAPTGRSVQPLNLKA
ncbi:sedoheptulose 7-phosphate cyclase [Cryobacterium sp. M15]|jgi:3-dehydroquinate synthase|uniref:sedoheptulose 7-phosphate cyclase n=1 Tax=Cryobacterium sp. M15 TaxID=2048291 RepID=UPI000CE4B440|nr:sedoheptulose 7-phosphate cyclase [Cryobacterium sp. M15]